MYFKMWSYYHFLYIISPFVIAFAVYYLVRNKDELIKRYVGIGIGALCVAIFIARTIFILNRSGFSPELIPLQVCHIANFVILYAFIKDDKKIYSWMWCFFFMFGFLAIVFADSLTNYSSRNIQFFAYIFGHLFIVVGIVYAQLIKKIKIDKKILISTFYLIGIHFIACIVANLVLNAFKINNSTANYMYLDHPESGTPMDILFNSKFSIVTDRVAINIPYILGLGVFAIIIVFVFYYLNALLNKKK